MKTEVFVQPYFNIHEVIYPSLYKHFMRITMMMARLKSAGTRSKKRKLKRKK